MALSNTDVSNHANPVDAAAKVFNEYGDFIRAVIRCKVRNENQTEDLFQDFFLSLVSKPIPAGTQNIKSYLYKAITNDVVDAARRVANYQIKVRKYAQHCEYSKNGHAAENNLMLAEETNKMFELIKSRLQSNEAQALVLRYRNQHRIKDIAVEMGLSKTVVWRRILSGLRKVRYFLKIGKLQ